MKNKIIMWLLRMLGHKPQKQITISINCDASQALEEMKKCTDALDEIMKKQRDCDIKAILKKEEK